MSDRDEEAKEGGVKVNDRRRFSIGENGQIVEQDKDEQAGQPEPQADETAAAAKEEAEQPAPAETPAEETGEKPKRSLRDRIKDKIAGKSEEAPDFPSGGMLPEIDFAGFVLSLSTSVVMYFGEMEDPVTGEKQQNLPAAKQTIDILGMLKEKTKGNLTAEEDRFLEAILYDLRMRYVSLTKPGAGGEQ